MISQLKNFFALSVFLLAFLLPSFESRAANVKNGIDVLIEENFSRLEGQRVGLITNHSGISLEKKLTADYLHEAANVKLVRLFSPEHGIRGKLDQAVIDDEVDPKTGLKVVSLFGSHKAPTMEELKGLDTLVFDIQDIGTRFFTYISTMKHAMRSADKAGIKFMVLDRINPIGGEKVEGPYEIDKEVFVGIHPIPVRHGMTVGELAKLFKADMGLSLELEVVKVQGWKRAMTFEQTGIEWRNPSPIMNGPLTALIYPGVGLLEFEASVGRGAEFVTDDSGNSIDSKVFERVGAPYVGADALVAQLRGLNLPGVKIEADKFTPNRGPFANEVCHGARFIVTDEEAFEPVSLGLALGLILYRFYPRNFDLKRLNVLMLNQETVDAIKGRDSFKKINARWKAQAAKFKERRKPYLLYN